MSFLDVLGEISVVLACSGIAFVFLFNLYLLGGLIWNIIADKCDFIDKILGIEKKE